MKCPGARLNQKYMLFRNKPKAKRCSDCNKAIRSYNKSGRCSKCSDTWRCK